MPYLYPLDVDGKPTGKHGLLDLAAIATTEPIHELIYDVESIDEVSVEIRLLDGGSFSGTTVDVQRGVSADNAGFAAMASAMSFTAAGSKFGGDVADVPRLRVKNTTPGSGAGKAMVIVWGSPLR